MKRAAVSACLLVLLWSGAASATLWDRGGGLIYDDSLDITWLQDANYAETTGYSENGLHFSKGTAMQWAADLEYYDPVRDVIWDDWRLPTALNPDGSGPDFGLVSTSEMGHLYQIDGISTSMSGLFINIQSETPYFYWTSTTSPIYDHYAMIFDFRSGNQSHVGQWGSRFAWAVRDGDVGAPVPEPTTMLLLGTGLTGLAAVRRRKKQ